MNIWDFLNQNMMWIFGIIVIIAIVIIEIIENKKGGKNE